MHIRHRCIPARQHRHDPRAGLDMDSKTLSPLVDTVLRTSRPGVFASGNLVHPVDTADIAALDDQHVARHVRDSLMGMHRPPMESVSWPTLRCGGSPGILRPGDPAPARYRLLMWTDTLVRIPKITVRQDGKVIAKKTLPSPASPDRVFHLSSSVLAKADIRGCPVTLSIDHSAWPLNSALRRGLHTPS